METTPDIGPPKDLLKILDTHSWYTAVWQCDDAAAAAAPDAGGIGGSREL